MSGAIRIVLVGAESTGKTTLCRALTSELRCRGGAWARTCWVPEVGREHTEELLAVIRSAAAGRGEPEPEMAAIEWSSTDFVAIARAQNEREDRHAARTGPVLLCDTDAFATGIWHERYLGSASAAVGALARHHPLYLVPDPDEVPFVQDGIRDGEAIRSWMHERFIERLEETGRRFEVLVGHPARRQAQAVAAIGRLMATDVS